MGTDEVLARLAEQARTNIADFVSEEPKALMVGRGENAQVVYIESGSLNWEEIRKRGHLIKKISFNQYGPVIEVVDNQAALVHIGKHLKLFADVQEHQGSVQVVGMSLDEWKAQQAERRLQVEETAALFEEDENE